MNILKSRKGYTLVELLVVIGIIAVLASISIPVVSGIVQRSKLSSDNTKAQNYESAISIWKSETPNESIVYYNNLSSTTFIGTLKQVEYTNAYMGTKQLPGIEFTNATQIRNATIAAIESVALENIQPDASGNYFLPHPECSGYGFKYYYRSGKISVEKVDAAHIISNDESYKYWIWLDDHPSAPVSICSTPVSKYNRIDVDPSTNVVNPTFAFVFSAEDIERCVFTIENEECSYTLSGKNKTAQVFVEGTYRIRYYLSGELKADSMFRVDTINIQSGIVTISFDGSSSMQLSSNKNDFTYSADGTTILKYNGSDSIIVVPSINAGKTIKIIGTDAFKNSSAKRIILPDTIVSIQSGAFSFCDELEYIAIPSSNLAENSIMHCPKLEEIDFFMPNTINSLSSLALRDNKRTIAYSAIHNCRKLTKIELTNLYRNINDGAFEQLKTEQTSHGISFTVNIDSTTDDMVTSIYSKNYVNFNVTPLKMFQTVSPQNIYFSADAKDKYTGEDTLCIPHIIVTNNNTTHQWISVASPTETQRTQVKGLRSAYSKLIVSEGYKSIGDNAFNAFQFNTISLPSTLVTIGKSAFAGNKALSIDIPSNVENIGDKAFASETLETITIRCNLDAITNKSLAGCNRVRTILIYNFDGDKSSITHEYFGLSEDVDIIFA